MRQARWCLIIFALITFAAADAFATPIQWSGNGHWYDLSTNYAGVGRTKTDVQDWAATQDHNDKVGYLVTITSQEEQAFIVDILLAGAGSGWKYWTGAKRWDDGDGVTPLGWSWDHGNGDPWSYTHWHAGQPSTVDAWDDMYIDTSTGEWYTAQHWYEFTGGIVEFDQAPIPAAVWLLGSGLLGLIGIRKKISR